MLHYSNTLKRIASSCLACPNPLICSSPRVRDWMVPVRVHLRICALRCCPLALGGPSTRSNLSSSNASPLYLRQYLVPVYRPPGLGKSAFTSYGFSAVCSWMPLLPIRNLRLKKCNHTGPRLVKSRAAPAPRLPYRLWLGTSSRPTLQLGWRTWAGGISRLGFPLPRLKGRLPLDLLLPHSCVGRRLLPPASCAFGRSRLGSAKRRGAVTSAGASTGKIA